MKTRTVATLGRAVRDGNIELVREHIIAGVNVNGYVSTEIRPINLALSLKNEKAKAEIIEMLARAGAHLPLCLRENSAYLYMRLPELNQIEYYSDVHFIRAERLREQIRKANKDVVIIFNAQYDHTPDSIYFGAMRNYLEQSEFDYFNKRSYVRLATQFSVFRVLINHPYQIEPIIRRIKREFLNEDKQILHLLLHAHSCPRHMRFGFDDQNDVLNYDSSSESYMKEAFAQLSQNATIGLFGCETEDLAAFYSQPEIANGRVVFGSPHNVGMVIYKILGMSNPNVGPQLYFRNGLFDSKTCTVTAYKNGEKIADCDWKTISRDKSARAKL